MLYIKAGSMIDGAGAPPVADVTVVVDGNRIAWIGPSSQAPMPGSADRVVEAGSSTLLPGMIDTHVHLCLSGGADVHGDATRDSNSMMLLRAAQNARLALQCGATTVRDAGGRGLLVQELRDAVNRGVVSGPRILASGMPITTTCGHLFYFGLEADNADEARKAVRELSKSGVDMVKVCATGGNLTPGSNSRAAQYSVEDLRAVVEDAHRLGKIVGAHCHAAEGVRRAVAAGMDIVDHSTWLGEMEGHQYDESCVNNMVAQGTFISANFSTPRFSKGGFNATDYVLTEPDARDMLHRRMLRAGVRFTISTDAGTVLNPLGEFTYAIEDAVHSLGITPLQAIQLVTGNAAEALGLAHLVGTIAVGKEADLLIVDGNPAQDIRALHHVKMLYKAGGLVAQNGHLCD